MRLIRLSALTIALVGFGMARADDSAPEAEAAAAGPAPRAATEQVLWSEFHGSGESSLLTQARAVFSALQPPQGTTVQVVDATVADNPGREEAGFCRHMALPGSLFMAERCFYSSPAEKAFNHYQFQMEIIQIREQHDLDFLEEAQFGLAYRRHLAQQPAE